MENKVKQEPAKAEEYPGEGAGDFLKIIAWLYLVASIIVGISLMMHKSGASRYSLDTDPVFVFYGIGLIVSGVIFLAVCQVLIAISSNLRTIAQNSAMKN